jgi:phosphomannomutase/phosphoglucomutase
MKEGEPHTLVEKLKREAKFPNARELITIDGVRAEYSDGFGLARASNTTPVLVLRFEADSDEALARIQAEFKTALQSVWKDLDVSF